MNKRRSLNIIENYKKKRNLNKKKNEDILENNDVDKK